MAINLSSLLGKKKEFEPTIPFEFPVSTPTTTKEVKLDALKPIMEPFGLPGTEKIPAIDIPGLPGVLPLTIELAARTPELLVSLPIAAVNFFRKNINAIVS